MSKCHIVGNHMSRLICVLECPICADGKICVVDDDGEAVCACPAGTRLNMMGTCSKCPGNTHVLVCQPRVTVK